MITKKEKLTDFQSEVKREAIRRVLEGEEVSSVASSLQMPESLVEELVGKFLLARQSMKLKRFEKEKAGKTADYRIKSMSEIDFPEMFTPIAPEFLGKLDPERARELIIKQALAQEKVGYERYAPKYFLPIEEDPFPEDRRQGAPRFIAARDLLVFATGLFAGLGVYAALVAGRIDLQSLGWLPAVGAFTVFMALLASLILAD